MSTWFCLSFLCVRSDNFGWSPLYDCKAYLETNTVKNCSIFGFGGYFLVAGAMFLALQKFALKEEKLELKCQK